MSAYRLISSDSHFVEPPNMWAERMDRRFRDRAPHTVTDVPGREGEYFVCENITPTPVAGYFGAGFPPDQQEEHRRRGFAAAPASVWDPAARITDQERDGVQAEVIYTSMGMPLFGLEDGELRAACFRAFNDWAAEYSSYDLKRLIPLGLITLEDVEAAVKELNRIQKKGMGGAMIWAEPPDERPYSHPLYEPFWAVAQELDLPLSLHILTSAKGLSKAQGAEQVLAVATLNHQIERTLANMVMSGVFEKFPRLRVVSAENDVGWIPYLMYRLDKVQWLVGGLTGYKLPHKPSDYFRRQIYATFIADPVFVDTLNHFGPDNIMWSSDYPHTAATFPHSAEWVEKRLGKLADDQRRKIVHDTVARVYRLEQ